MKKIGKAKAAKRAKKSPQPEVQGPDLVTAMMKLVERLEVLERKTDQVLGRIGNLPSEIRNAGQRPQQPQHTPQHSHQPPRSQQVQQQGQGGRPMYQAVCADCKKSCEVPFKPGDRPVYCKECFAIRKAGHKPQDPDRRNAAAYLNQKAGYAPSPQRFNPQGIETLPGNVTVFKGRKRKPVRNGNVKAKKKR